MGWSHVQCISIIEEFSSKIKQIHFWYFWEKQVSLTEFIHMSVGKQNLGEKMYLCELSGSKFHSVISSNVILYNDVKNSVFIKSGFIWFWNWALLLLLWVIWWALVIIAHIVSWEPEGHYHHRLCTVIMPFWFSMEHLSILIGPLWLSTDDISIAD